FHVTGVQTCALPISAEDEIERVWQTYWLPTLRGEDGKVSLERLKAELYDAYFLVDQARRVYHHVTGGLTDDLTASADGIIALAEIGRASWRERRRVR